MLFAIKVALKLFCTIGLAIIVLTNAVTVKESILSTLSRCLYSLLPSIFPMMIIAPLIAAELSKAKGRMLDFITKFFGVSKNLFPSFLVGCICGYPIPATIIKEQYLGRSTSKCNAEYAICLFNNTSPAFIISYIGGVVFGSLSLGILLYMSQLLSVCILSRIFIKRETQIVSPTNIKYDFPTTVRKSTYSFIEICAFIAVFSLLADIMIKLTGLRGNAAVILTGMIEITKGLSYITTHSILSQILACMLTSMSGVSVYFQISSIIKDTNLSIKKYLYVRVLIFILTLLLFLPMSIILDKQNIF